jgi:hypothetical protein
VIISLGTDDKDAVAAVLVGLTDDDIERLQRGEMLTAGASHGIQRFAVIAGHSNEALVLRIGNAGCAAGVEMEVKTL